MKVSPADTTRLWSLAAREAWRRARRALRAGPPYAWRYSGRTPERVVIAPPDLRLADPQIAVDIYYGRFPLSGHLVDTGGQSPFKIDVADRGWQRSLHGFRWLRHMRAAETELAAANARALVADWIASHGRSLSGVAWEPDVVAKRTISWLQHSSVVLQGAEFVFYRSFLRSLAIQLRYLRSAVRDMPDGKARLRARIALCFAALSLPAPASALRSATRALSDELDRQILPDGGHVSRNPLAIMALLADLLPLRYTYTSQAEQPPAALIGAIDRMMPALRFFRHQDGSLARFNGMGVTIHDRVAAILLHDDTGASTLLHAPHSGYERLAVGTTTVIADTGTPPPPVLSGGAHAGCLSFELSSGQQRIIVNAGVDTYGSDAFRPLARATAAHSTATVNDTSQARFTYPPRLAAMIGAPLLGGPREVRSQRIDRDGMQGFVASHDAYAASFGLMHERELRLNPSGTVLVGRDRFFRAPGRPAPREGRDLVTLRFHLHPDTHLYRDEDEQLVLSCADGEQWLMESPDAKPAVEESIFFAGLGGPRRSRQIVLSFKASEQAEARWRFTRLAAPQPQGGEAAENPAQGPAGDDPAP